MSPRLLKPLLLLLTSPHQVQQANSLLHSSSSTCRSSQSSSKAPSAIGNWTGSGRLPAPVVVTSPESMFPLSGLWLVAPEVAGLAAPLSVGQSLHGQLLDADFGRDTSSIGSSAYSALIF